MKKRIFLVLTCMILASGIAFAKESYVIDKTHSYIGFSVKHLLITDVKGNFKDFQGEINVNEKKPEKSSVNVTIQASSIYTGDEKRDEHLRSADFFNVKKHPLIKFKSKKIEKKDKGKFLVKGSLEMNGIKKDIEIPVSVTERITDPWGKTRFGANGSIEINRKNWDISWNKTMDRGGLVVGNEVKIELAIEAQEK